LRPAAYPPLQMKAGFVVTNPLVSNSRRVLVTVAGLAIAVAGAAPASAQQAPVGLGTASTFAVLAGETITNTGPTTITGDVGLHPGTATPGFASVTLNGASHITDAVAQQAKVDLVTAYDDAAGRIPVSIVATELGGQVLPAGVYASESGTFEITGTLTLDAQGDPNATFIFQMASTLNTASASSVNVINGGTACNVYWQVGSSATLGTGSTFRGTIMALTSIALTTGATIEGRALARNGEVTMDTNTISAAACQPVPTTTASTTAPTTATTPAVSLPRTGSSLTFVTLLGLLVAGAGAASLAAASRRTQHEAR